MLITNFTYPLLDLCTIDPVSEIIRKLNDVIGYDITQHTRKQEVVKGRQIAMWYLRNHTTLSLQEIGQTFNRDHATVLHACKVVQNIIDTKDKKYLPIVEKVIK